MGLYVQGRRRHHEKPAGWIRCQHAYKTALLILEAKYYLYFENDLDKAREIYNTAQVLSQAFGDEVFIKNLKMEMEKDLNIK